VIDFELFRADLERAVPRSDRTKGGRVSGERRHSMWNFGRGIELGNMGRQALKL
jgi:hypothetical protein